MSRICIATAICFLLATPCAANNNYFIPGDAFFYFELDESEWKAFQSRELKTVDYDRPEVLPFTLGGYAGFKTLDVSNLSDQFHGRLVEAISLVKEKYPTKVVEIDHGKPKFLLDPAGTEKKEVNKIRIFIYNKSYDFSQFRVGLKYNETWPDTAVRMGLDRRHFRYDYFVSTPKGISESWRWGTAVNGLVVEYPDSDRGYVQTPMKIDPSQVTFLICPPISLESLCFPSREASIHCFAVSDDGTVKLANDTSKGPISGWVEAK